MAFSIGLFVTLTLLSMILAWLLWNRKLRAKPSTYLAVLIPFLLVVNGYVASRHYRGDLRIMVAASQELVLGSPWDIYTVGNQNYHPPYMYYKYDERSLASGPFAYPPLYAVLLLPFYLLSTLSGISMGILGKIPPLLGDIACGLFIWSHVKRRLQSENKALAAITLWFLNPIVIIDSAKTGHFESILCFLAFMVIRYRKNWAVSGMIFGLALLLKTPTVALLICYLLHLPASSPQFRQLILRRAGTLGIALAVFGIGLLPFYLSTPELVTYTLSGLVADRPPLWYNLWRLVFPHPVLRINGELILLTTIVVSLIVRRTHLIYGFLITYSAAFIVSKVLAVHYLVPLLGFLLLTCDPVLWAFAPLTGCLAFGGEFLGTTMWRTPAHVLWWKLISLASVILRSVLTYLAGIRSSEIQDRPPFLRSKRGYAPCIITLVLLSLIVVTLITPITPNPAGLNTVKGNNYLRRGAWQTAEKYYRLAIDETFRYAGAHLGLGRVHEIGYRDFPAAISEYRIAVDVQPRLIEAHLRLGKLYDKLGQTGSAIQHLETVRRLDPTNREAAKLLLSLYQEEKKTSEFNELSQWLRRWRPDEIWDGKIRR